MVGNDERSMIDGASKIKDDLQPMGDDFDVMEDDKKIVVSLLTRAVLIHLNVLK